MNNIRARAIIPYKQGIVMIHRIRNINYKRLDYYVFPGGGVEIGETEEECVVRELQEELSIKIKVEKELYRLITDEQEEIFFLCKYITGNIKIGDGPEFKRRDRGEYIPTIVDLKDLHKLNFLKQIKVALIRDLKEYKDFKYIPNTTLK